MITTEPRKTGISIVEEVPWGTHLCQFYETRQDLLDALVPYFKEGLENNEMCLWFTCGHLTEQESISALGQSVRDLDQYLLARSLEIISHDGYRPKEEASDIQGLSGLNEKLEQALAKGYAGVRISGDFRRLEKMHWCDSYEYEKGLNASIGGKQIILLCTYPIATLGAAELLNVARDHRVATVRRNGHLGVVEISGSGRSLADIRRLNEDIDGSAERQAPERTAANEGSRTKIAGHDQADEGIRAREECFGRHLKLGNMGMAIMSPSKDYLEVNDRICEILGYERSELLRMTWVDLSHPDDVAVDLAGFDHVLTGDSGGYSMDRRFIRKDGRIVEAAISMSCVGRRNGSADNVMALVQDVTERRRAEKALRESEEHYRLLFENSPHPMWVFDLRTFVFLDVNEAAIRHYGYSREEFLAMTSKDIRPSADVPTFVERLTNWSNETFRAEAWKHRKRDGSIIDVEITSHKVTFASRPACVVLATDVTERNRAEGAIREAETKYRSIFENAVEGIFQFGPDGRYSAVNPAMARILGYESPDELMASCTIIATQHYADGDSWRELASMLAERGVVTNFECEVLRKDRSRIWAVESIRAIRDEAGKVQYYEGSFEDITERKVLEEQLRQSHKMEAIGQLAGGIAHDFNNLLIAITGYSELAIKRLKAEDPLRRNIEGIIKAGERAASLTSQLLAFSRKQVLQPRVLDLNAVVSETEKMLRRLIGENIELRTALEPGLGRIKADPGQIEQVIMNLVVNARDAMPDGGALTIETENVLLDEAYVRQHVALASGAYVTLAIIDTGAGIDEDTQRRIFEPFFTTKEVGKGTGLGLSTVYGIVKQSGGDILVYSEVGRGTTFRIYLPRLSDDSEEFKRGSDPEGTLHGTETVLMAEDDEMVRMLTREVLEAYGYNVLEAANGDSAVLICALYVEPIHLLISDVIMPGMTGTELADRLAEVRPKMKVLYMSGYTDNSVVHRRLLNKTASFLQKPFTPKSLARKVREVLDAV